MLGAGKKQLLPTWVARNWAGDHHCLAHRGFSRTHLGPLLIDKGPDDMCSVNVCEQEEAGGEKERGEKRRESRKAA